MFNNERTAESGEKKYNHLAHLQNNENNVIKSWSNASTRNLIRRLPTNLFKRPGMCVRLCAREQLLIEVFESELRTMYEIFYTKVRNILTF